MLGAVEFEEFPLLPSLHSPGATVTGNPSTLNPPVFPLFKIKVIITCVFRHAMTEYDIAQCARTLHSSGHTGTLIDHTGTSWKRGSFRLLGLHKIHVLLL